jgi:hypothetical protein
MNRMNRSLLLTLCAIVLLAGAVASAATIRPMQGEIILAKSGNDASQYLWDATPYVQGLVNDRELGQDGMNALEATGISALAAKAGSSHSDSVALEISYKPVSANSIYGSPTFGDRQPLCTLAAKRDDLIKNASTWAAELASGNTPPGLKVSVTGKLPPG